MNNSINPAQGTIRTVAGASSQGSVSDVRACFTFSYPGPFTCQACEHVEAVFARIVNHCTHHNVLVNGLTCSLCSKHFRTVNAVASHFIHCRKVANSVPAPATVTPLDSEVSATAATSHVCPTCCRTFSTFSGLRLHEKRKHASTFVASSQRPKNHRWSEHELHDVRAILVKLEKTGSSSLAKLADELSCLWQESISVNTAKYLRKKALATESSEPKSLTCTSLQSTDCVESIRRSSPRELKKITSVREETIGEGRENPKAVKTEIPNEVNDLFIQNSNLNYENVCHSTPTLENQESTVDKMENFNSLLIRALEESLTSCNTEMEGLINFLIKKILKSDDEARKHYTDGVVSVLAALLRPNCDGRNPPAPTNQRKRIPPSARNRSERIRAKYASFQSLFRRDPKRIAAHLIKNQPFVIAPVPTQRPSNPNALPTPNAFCPPSPQTRCHTSDNVTRCALRRPSTVFYSQEDCISLHPRQKAFRSGTHGAFNNPFMLMTIIREAHKRGKELNIVSAEEAKALDTINHTINSVPIITCLVGTRTEGGYNYVTPYPPTPLLV
ncbi:Zinc finger protein [Trichinella spiralis]|uniref:Zinc finger protein n=1 Tax=Trichinella spiralis TaxID=6334 RepID=A0ABR3KGG3_TRISP